jgi:hypothetical protein
MSAIGQGDTPPPTTTAAPSDGAPPPTTETPAAPAPDFDRLFSRMDEMSTQQREMASQMSALLNPPEEEIEPEYYDETGEMTEEGAQALIRGLVSEQVKEALAPHEKARLVRQRDDAYEDLKEEYPELADEKIGGQVLQASIAWANKHNPDLIDKPEFVDLIEWVYKAEFRTPEAPEAEAGRRVELESAGGAGGRTQRKTPEVDWGDRIVKAAERLRPSI